MAEWSRQEDTLDRVMERKERVDLLLDRQRCHQLLQCESRSPQCASAVPPATIKVYIYIYKPKYNFKQVHSHRHL